MKIPKVLKSLAAAGALAAAASAEAGSWLTAYGSSPESATNAALTTAKAFLKHRESGCLDGRSQIEVLDPYLPLFKIRVYVHHTTKPCGQRSQEEQLLDDVTKKIRNLIPQFN